MSQYVWVGEKASAWAVVREGVVGNLLDIIHELLGGLVAACGQMCHARSCQRAYSSCMNITTTNATAPATALRTDLLIFLLIFCMHMNFSLGTKFV